MRSGDRRDIDNWNPYAGVGAHRFQSQTTRHHRQLRLPKGFRSLHRHPRAEGAAERERGRQRRR